VILTRAVALGDPRGRKQYVSALSVFLIVFSVWSGLGALRAPKLDPDAGVAFGLARMFGNRGMGTTCILGQS